GKRSARAASERARAFSLGRSTRACAAFLAAFSVETAVGAAPFPLPGVASAAGAKASSAARVSLFSMDDGSIRPRAGASFRAKIVAAGAAIDHRAGMTRCQLADAL